MECVKCGKKLTPFSYNKKTLICKQCQRYRPCAICGRLVSPYGLKILSDGTEICRKGLCRRIYEDHKERPKAIEESKAMYKWSKAVHG